MKELEWGDGEMKCFNLGIGMVKCLKIKIVEMNKDAGN